MEKIRLKLKAYDHRVLDRSVVAIVEAVKRSGSEIRGLSLYRLRISVTPFYDPRCQ